MFRDRKGRQLSFEEYIETAADDPHIMPVDQIGLAEVSTVFLPVTLHASDPMFETMIFGGDHDQSQCRYHSEVEAAAGHFEAVQALREGRVLSWFV